MERGVEDALFLSALVAGLADAEGPILLVLDGLPADLDRATVAGLALLVERAGDNVRVVATTRTDPPLPLARWRALGWLNDLREDSLRLTDEEAVSIAQPARYLVTRLCRRGRLEPPGGWLADRAAHGVAVASCRGAARFVR